MKQIIYVSHDQLNLKYGALKNADPKNDLIVLVESARMVTGDNWNKVRLYFLISSALHFAEELKEAGFKVIYQKAATTVNGLKMVQSEYKDLPIRACAPSSFRLHKSLSDFGVEIC
jgi:deoxyribodipyrimidine photolyase-related protein